MAKIAVLYISTGKYSYFWDGFYSSSQEFFLPKHEKHFFVFTDSEKIKKSKNVTVIDSAYKGFPLDSLFRFEKFWSIKDELSGFDYTYFFNANMYFTDTVGEEILPGSLNDGLVALIHPGYYNKNRRFLPFERNKRSLAFIPREKKNYKYYQGCLNGGTTTAYLQLVSACMKNTKRDYEEGIIARVHDESHLNCYLSEKKVLGLDPSYGYPEDWSLPFSKRITQLDKNKYIPGIKASEESFFRKWKRRSATLWRIIYWSNKQK